MGGSLLTHQQTAGVTKLIFGSFLAILPTLSRGCVLSFATIGLPKMMEPNKTGVLLDIHQISWINSISLGSGVVALLLSKYLNERIGRKKSLITATILQVISTCCVYFCNSFLSLAIMIGLANLFSAMLTVPGYSLLSEICLIRYRSPLATLNTNGVNIGWLLGLCVGLVIPIHIHYPTLCLFSVIFLCLCWFLPESPVWLMRNGRESESRSTLKWLRGVNYDIEPEMEDLKQIVDQEDNVSGISILNVLTNQTFLKPLSLCCILFTLQALSGTVLISFYSAVIFKDVGVSSEHLAIIYQTVILVGYFVSAPLQTKLDCKHINIIFYISMGFSMLGLALSFLYPSLGSYVSIPCLVVAGASYGLGVGPVAFVLMASLFPQKNKSLGVAISQTAHALILFTLLKAFPVLVKILDMEGLFILATVISVAGAVFTFFWIPITKDKSMYELEMLFAPKETSISEGLDLFKQESILQAEEKPEFYFKIPEEWLEPEISIKKRKSVWF